MFIDTDGIDLIDIRNGYEEIIEIFDGLIERTEVGRKKKNYERALILYLDGFVADAFSVNPDYFIQESFREIDDLMALDEGEELDISIMGVYRFKIEQILGLDKKIIDNIRLKSIAKC